MSLHLCASVYDTARQPAAGTRLALRSLVTAMTRRQMLRLAAAAAFARPGKSAPYQPAIENLAARRWFQDAKFGMFIHWGVYSVLGKAEWVLNNTRMSSADYEKLAPLFNPVKYAPSQLGGRAKAAGLRDITSTSKHHYGVSMVGT